MWLKTDSITIDFYEHLNTSLAGALSGDTFSSIASILQTLSKTKRGNLLSLQNGQMMNSEPIYG